MSDDLHEEYGAGDGGDEEAESLASFLESQGVSVSESDEEAEPGETKAKRAKHSTDETEGTGEETDEAPPDDSYSRMARKQGRLTRELTTKNARIRQLEQHVQQLSQQSQQGQEPDDVVELVRHRIAKGLGLQPNDQRVTDALFEVAKDITVEHMGSAADTDPSLKALRQQRADERKRREERRGLEERISKMEQERQDAVQQAQRAGAEAGVAQLLGRDAANYEFLMNQPDVDPIQAVVDLTLEAISTGRVKSPSTDQEATRLIRQVATNLDGHYRAMAETLAARLNPAKASGKSAGRIVSSADTDEDETTTRKVRKQGAPMKRKGTTQSGGGGRGHAPQQQQSADEDDESLVSFWRKTHETEQAQRRGRR